MAAIRDRIVSYMQSRLGLEMEEIQAIRNYSLPKYGTTLLGLKERFDIDECEYLDYVHDINLTAYIQKDIRLFKMLEAYPQRKIILTNANTKHAKHVLGHLGILHFFEIIVDYHTLTPLLKPHRKAFETAMEIADLPSWTGCAFIDDRLENVEKARELGIYSILIDESDKFEDTLKITSIMELPKLIPLNDKDK